MINHPEIGKTVKCVVIKSTFEKVYTSIIEIIDTDSIKSITNTDSVFEISNTDSIKSIDNRTPSYYVSYNAFIKPLSLDEKIHKKYKKGDILNCLVISYSDLGIGLALLNE